MTGINVQPQLIIRRHNNRKRLFRLRNLTSLLRLLKFFTIYLRSVKHDTKCGWKLQRSFFFVGQYLQRGPCLISVLHIDCYQALTLLMHTHKQAQRQVSNRGLPSQSEWQDCFITFAFLCFLVGMLLNLPACYQHDSCWKCLQDLLLHHMFLSNKPRHVFIVYTHIYIVVYFHLKTGLF